MLNSAQQQPWCLSRCQVAMDLQSSSRVLWRASLGRFIWTTLTESPKTDWIIFFYASTLWVPDKLKLEEALGLTTPSSFSLYLSLSVNSVLTGPRVGRGKTSLSVCASVSSTNDVSVFPAGATPVGCKACEGLETVTHGKVSWQEVKDRRESQWAQSALGPSVNLHFVFALPLACLVRVNSWDGSTELLVTANAEVLSAGSGTACAFCTHEYIWLYFFQRLLCPCMSLNSKYQMK